MTPIENIIAQGECETLEFKPSFNQDVIETAVAFANTRGGMMVVGVSNSGEPLDTSFSKEALRDFVNRISTATKPSVIPEPKFENYSGGFRVLFKTKAPVEAPVEAPVDLSDTERKLLLLLASAPLGRKELIDGLGYTQRTGNFIKAQKRLLEKELMERTIPNKPASRLQKYRLTHKGTQCLQGMNPGKI